jgi:hypothetical protein
MVEGVGDVVTAGGAVSHLAILPMRVQIGRSYALEEEGVR